MFAPGKSKVALERTIVEDGEIDRMHLYKDTLTADRALNAGGLTPARDWTSAGERHDA
ncbi:hypothetical protein [Fodinicola feengrottensis]|uniref:hypothetical protein n=1 Tax=Fodinicola feengrottensis TaxID=435914 RepID=UPI0024426B79|nr:hypothetical protein [Fodinicola feengrottensis]